MDNMNIKISACQALTISHFHTACLLRVRITEVSNIKHSAIIFAFDFLHVFNFDCYINA
jgi:hypothetical protein